MHRYITTDKIHRAPEEPALSVLESTREKSVTLKFKRLRQRNRTLLRKAYDKERLQETRDDLPKKEPIDSNLFRLMDYVQPGRSFDSVRWIKKAVTKRRRRKMQTTRALSGDSKHLWSESQWRSDLFVRWCQAKKRKVNLPSCLLRMTDTCRQLITDLSIRNYVNENNAS